MLLKILPFAHDLMKKTLNEGDIAIDGTCGNGNDTLLLSTLVGDKGKVYGFDIQQQAIEQTKQLLADNHRKNVSVILDGHEYVDKYIDKNVLIGGAIFNLGYLPRGNKEIVTKPKTTIASLDKIIQLLKPGGMVVVVVYYGHKGGGDEKDAIINHLQRYDQKTYSVLQYGFINQKNTPPFLLAIEKS
ncbi:class I SAM-dependent methyltransferase [Aquibacillus salsiterrae]|uniref:Class I SAM-dependent methyltransferase n=1 Tax=Aquibacillus salsiterrae TaxID=2950439 RepID=A0A9X4AHJ3_9BACI|nr:class I SAM-dependent methyltransferase [Aquibacillus salsiterrae]MDC3418268.1 class I SAM-dependent methyltransferase [Aquibacillus salsiterrae]